MGLIQAAFNAAGGVLADQWKEFFRCEEIPANVLMLKGQKVIGGRSSNTKGTDNIITSGSAIVVADGQCMMIVDQGQIVEFCSEPGEYIYDASTEPTIFCGSLGEGIKQSFAAAAKRFTFGGEPPKDQRVYYFNTRELTGNKYGTPGPIPFRVVDARAGIDIDISIRCFGEYSYRICDPILFYKNVSSSVAEAFTRDAIDGQLKTELLTALQPAFGRISQMGIRYSALPMHAEDIAQALNEVLSEKWGKVRGLEVVSVGVSNVSASEEDEKMIKEMQRNAAFMDPTRAGAHLIGAQAAAMQAAAANEGAGAAMAFMGMNMAGGAGANAQNLFQMGQQPQAPQTPPPAPTGWTCPACGTAGINGKFCPECGGKKPEPRPAEGAWTCPACGTAGITGKFCPECGAKKPETVNPAGWTCPGCGLLNKGKFCAECGTKKPEGAPKYQCDKCGWEPEDPTNPPKFCPECGDPFDESDLK